MNAATDAFKEDLIEFQRALNIQNNIDLHFYDIDP